MESVIKSAIEAGAEILYCYHGSRRSWGCQSAGHFIGVDIEWAECRGWSSPCRQADASRGSLCPMGLKGR